MVIVLGHVHAYSNYSTITGPGPNPTATPVPLIFSPPHTPEIKYSQYIILYHIMGVCGRGGLPLRGGDYLEGHGDLVNGLIMGIIEIIMAYRGY